MILWYNYGTMEELDLLEVAGHWETGFGREKV